MRRLFGYHEPTRRTLAQSRRPRLQRHEYPKAFLPAPAPVNGRVKSRLSTETASPSAAAVLASADPGSIYRTLFVSDFTDAREATKRSPSLGSMTTMPTSSASCFVRVGRCNLKPESVHLVPAVGKLSKDVPNPSPQRNHSHRPTSPNMTSVATKSCPTNEKRSRIWPASIGI